MAGGAGAPSQAAAVLAQEATRLRGYLEGYLGPAPFSRAISAVKQSRMRGDAEAALTSAVAAALDGDSGTAEHFLPLLQTLAALEGQ